MALANGEPGVSWFEWGTRGSFDNATPVTALDVGTGVQFLDVAVSGLTNNTAYQFRLVVSNATAQVYGTPRLFTTGRKVVAWGDNGFGESAVPAGLSGVVDAGGGNGYSMALKNDGTVLAWGTGAGNSPPPLTNVAAIAAGRYHGLALLSDSTVVAWGTWEDGPAVVPPGFSNIVAISAGDTHDLLLKSDGTVTAIGYDTVGQANVPAGLSNVVDIMAGYTFSVALLANGSVVAFGLVAGSPWQPVNVPADLTNVVRLGGSDETCLALRNDSTVVSLGYQTNVPAGLSNVMGMAAGETHSLALLADSTVVAWGSGSQTNVPATLSNVVSIAAGQYHSLALGNRSPVASSHTNSGFPNRDLVILLQASDPDGDPVSMRLGALPTNGLLFQYSGGFRGPAIVAPNTVVTSAVPRVIFAPPTNSVGQPVSAFTFLANDGQVDSAPGTIAVNIILPSAPVLNLTNSHVLTNGQFDLEFSGTDSGNLASGGSGSISSIYRVWASSNLMDWDLLGTATLPNASKQDYKDYQFIDVSATNYPQRFYRAGAP
jgi:hypothetical protein